jgi:hypothetical protein
LLKNEFLMEDLLIAFSTQDFAIPTGPIPGENGEKRAAASQVHLPDGVIFRYEVTDGPDVRRPAHVGDITLSEGPKRWR